MLKFIFTYNKPQMIYSAIISINGHSFSKPIIPSHIQQHTYALLSGFFLFKNTIQMFMVLEDYMLS